MFSMLSMPNIPGLTYCNMQISMLLRFTIRNASHQPHSFERSQMTEIARAKSCVYVYVDSAARDVYSEQQYAAAMCANNNRNPRFQVQL